MVSFSPFTDCLKFSVSLTWDTFLIRYSCDFSGFVSNDVHLLTISVNSLSIFSDAPAVPFSYFSNLSTNSSSVAFSSFVSSCWLSFFVSSFSVASVVSSGFLSSLFSLSSFLFSCVSAAVSFLLFSAVDVVVSGLFNDCSLLQLDSDTEAINASNNPNFLMFFIKSSSDFFIYIIPLFRFSNQENVYNIATIILRCLLLW